jgi:hypothetical protein
MQRDHVNDDKSPLMDLLSCIACNETMTVEKSSPDAEGQGYHPISLRFAFHKNKSSNPAEGSKNAKSSDPFQAALEAGMKAKEK